MDIEALYRIHSGKELPPLKQRRSTQSPLPCTPQEVGVVNNLARYVDSLPEHGAVPKNFLAWVNAELEPLFDVPRGPVSYNDGEAKSLTTRSFRSGPDEISESTYMRITRGATEVALLIVPKASLIVASRPDLAAVTIYRGNELTEVSSLYPKSSRAAKRIA